MLRTVLAIFLIAILAAGVWYGARWMGGRDDLHVTVVFKSAGELRRGARVIADGAVIGKVTGIARLESQQAVSITVEKEHRNELMRDSLYAITEDADGARLEVINTVAVGPPLPDGAVVHARDDRFTRWITKHGPEVGALLGRLQGKARELMDEYDSGRLKQDFEEYRQKLPEWRKKGDEVVRENVDGLTRKVEDVEKVLREHGRAREADELRKRLDQWRGEMKVGQPGENP